MQARLEDVSSGSESGVGVADVVVAGRRRHRGRRVEVEMVEPGKWSFGWSEGREVGRLRRSRLIRSASAKGPLRRYCQAVRRLSHSWMEPRRAILYLGLDRRTVSGIM